VHELVTVNTEQWEVLEMKERRGIVVVTCSVSRQTAGTCSRRDANRVGLSAATCKTEMEAVI